MPKITEMVLRNTCHELQQILNNTRKKYLRPIAKGQLQYRNLGKNVKRQMSEATKGRALGLLEAGWGVTEVAN